MYFTRPARRLRGRPRLGGRARRRARLVPGRGQHRRLVRDVRADQQPERVGGHRDDPLSDADAAWRAPRRARCRRPAARRSPVDALPGLAATDVSCSITATGNIIVERSMYWPGVPGPWYGAHNSVGITTLRHALGRWPKAKSAARTAPSTYVLLANPGTAAADVDADVLSRRRAPPIVVTRTVAGRLAPDGGGVASVGLGVGRAVRRRRRSRRSRSPSSARSTGTTRARSGRSGTNETGTPLN